MKSKRATTNMGLTVIQKDNRIKIYTPSEIRALDRAKEIKDMIIASIVIGTCITIVFVSYAYLFTEILK